MHTKLLEDYKRRILPNIEPPIREIVLALWEIPFVVDTDEACSGHIVTNNLGKSYAQYDPIRRGLYWYPQSIRLGIDFSLEDGLKEIGESFRRDISNINVDIGLREYPSERGYRTVDGEETRVLHVFYFSHFPERDFKPPQTGIKDFINATQTRLAEFWEAFSMVIKEYNPAAEISPVKGKNFLNIIDWADLGSPDRYIY